MPEITEVLSERQKTHGDFTHHAFISQSLKEVVSNAEGYDKLNNVQKEALDMILHKVARIIAGNPDEPDHWLDIQGYSKLVYDKVVKYTTNEA
jgi:hypothetical protein